MGNAAANNVSQSTTTSRNILNTDLIIETKVTLSTNLSSLEWMETSQMEEISPRQDVPTKYFVFFLSYYVL
jgi:hypothetical protein